MQCNILIAELLQSWRGLLKKPGYLALSSFTLAFGIASCVLVFALAEASLFGEIDVVNISEVMRLGPLIDKSNVGGLSPIQYQRLAGMPGVVSLGIAAPGLNTVNVAVGDQLVTIPSWHVSKGFLDILKTPLRLGRGFDSEEDQVDGPPAVILSYSYWQRNYAGNNNVLGSTIKVDGHYIPIIGVLPATFPYRDADLLLPLPLPVADQSWAGSYQIIARIGKTVDPGEISTRAEARLSALDSEFHMDRLLPRVIYRAQPLADALRADTGTKMLLVLFGACTGVVLAIVVVNLTNLLLLRLLSRSQESALRIALGASFLRTMLPDLAEQALVAATGSVLGLTAAWMSLRLAGNVIPQNWFVGASTRPTINLASLAFAFLIALLVVALSAAINCYRTRDMPLRETLAAFGRSGGERKLGSLGRILVIMQAALATVLLMLAAICGRTLWNASHVRYGFSGDHVLAFSVKPDRETYGNQQQVMAMADALVDRLESIPGTDGAAYGTNLPASGNDNYDTVPFLVGDGTSIPGVASYLVSPEFLNVLGVHLREGVQFDKPHDANMNSVLISRDLQKLLSGKNPIGRQLALPYHMVNPSWNDQPLQIRGVTNGVRAYGPGYDMPPVAWIPFMKQTEHLYDTWRDADSLYFIVRVHGDPASYERLVLRAEHETVADLAVSGLSPLREYQATNLSRGRLTLVLIGVLATVALLLASIGMYSVMAVNIASRERELSIRAALGAQPNVLLGLVFLDGSVQLGVGLGAGLVASFAASGFIRSVLYGARAADPLAVLVVIGLLTVGGLLACLGPALRAARSQPQRVLR